MRRRWIHALAIAGIAAALAGGCGPDQNGAVNGPAVAGVVRGHIAYAGTYEGPLQVGVFTRFPPTGRPIASQIIEAPVYPQPYAIAGVPQGRFFVLAIIDVDTTDGERYHPSRDPGGAFGTYLGPINVAVAANEGASGIDVTLVDPSDSSPWNIGSYR